MFRFLFKVFALGTIAGIGTLVYHNATMDDFKVAGKKILEKEQSAIRAGWSTVSKVTGLNALAKAAGMGNYELCRKNLYVASIFRVRNTQLLEETYPVALGIGALKKVTIMHSNVDPAEQSIWFTQLAGIASNFNFTECETVHNPGEF